jgi:hypothetical protein
MVLYSKLPLIDPEIRFLLKKDIPSIRTQIALPSGQYIWFYGIHSRPPSPTEAETTTRRDAELLIVGREAQQIKQPVIVAGDLNDVAWSYTTTLFQKMSGLLDPRIGRGFYRCAGHDTFTANRKEVNLKPAVIGRKGNAKRRQGHFQKWDVWRKPAAEPVHVANSEPATWVYGGGRAGLAERAPISECSSRRALKRDGIRGGSVSYPGKSSCLTV